MKDIADKTDKKQLLINKIYELGFEVGYNNHSEVGWVLREYTGLMKEARTLGIQSPESYYDNGKIKGKSSRDKGIGESSEKRNIEVRISSASDTKADLSNLSEDTDHFLKKPSHSEIPHLVEKISMVEIPKLLHGLKLIRGK